MESKTDIRELQQKIRKFCQDRDWDQYHNAKDLAIGVVTEASELLDHFRFKSTEEAEALLKDPKKRQEISEELADVLYFTLRIAQVYGIDIAAELIRKIAKNEEKYPIEKAKGSNKKYSEL